MNPYVADPAWGWWIIFYFFLGGIAAGAYFLATLIELFGQETDRSLARIGFRIAFPLVPFAACFSSSIWKDRNGSGTCCCNRRRKLA